MRKGRKPRLTAWVASLTLAGALLLCAPPAQAADYLVDPYTPYTYSQLQIDLAELEETYPALISSFSIGQSVEGREISALTFGRGSRDILLCGTMHGNEYITTAFLMYLVDRYAYGYLHDETYNGLSYRKLLEGVKFIIVPMVNPDGATIAQTSYPGWKANANGVDLNRNYPYYWSPGGTVTKPSYRDYRGPSAGSEPETQAMLALLANTPFDMLASFHTAGEVIYWIDSRTTDLADRYRDTADRFCRALDFGDMGVEDISTFGGYYTNYARGTYQRFCMTVELCPWTPLASYPDGDFDLVVENTYQIGLLMADEVLKTPPTLPNISVRVNDRNVAFTDQRPLIKNGRTLTPLRPVLEACGISVDWDSGSKTVIAKNVKTTVLIAIGATDMTVNGERVTLEVPAAIVNSRTLLPLRSVLEAFGATVGWDEQLRAALISY